jgi:hypothetical protein
VRWPADGQVSGFRPDTGHDHATWQLRSGRHSQFIIRFPSPTASVPTFVPTFRSSDRPRRDQLHEGHRRLPHLLHRHAPAVVQVLILPSLGHVSACAPGHRLHDRIRHTLLPGEVMEAVPDAVHGHRAIDQITVRSDAGVLPPDKATCSVPTLDTTRLLMVTDSTALANFSFQRVMNTITTSGHATNSSIAMYQAWMGTFANCSDPKKIDPDGYGIRCPRIESTAHADRARGTTSDLCVAMAAGLRGLGARLDTLFETGLSVDHTNIGQILDELKQLIVWMNGRSGYEYEAERIAGLIGQLVTARTGPYLEIFIG